MVPKSFFFVNSILLIMCTDAPEATPNSLSHGLIFGGDGKHHSNVREKNVAAFSRNVPSTLVFARNLSPTTCTIYSFRSSNVGAHGLR